MHTQVSSTASATLLTDSQMSGFVRDGYVVVQPNELPAELHAHLFSAAVDLYGEVAGVGGTTTHLQYLGDNLVARIPALAQLLHSPALQGAVRSILGDNAVLHPHHFVHSAGRSDQGFHQDGNLPWNARGHFRSHRPIAALLFYYPQDVTEELGPTEVLPTTHYWSGTFEDDESYHDDDRLDRSFDTDASKSADLAGRDRQLAESLCRLPFAVERRRITLPAGSMLLAHYDLMHRGTRQAVGCDTKRFMYKFTFLRTQEPLEPTWNNEHRTVDTSGLRPAHARTVERVWGWLRGDGATASSTETISALAAQLTSSDEHVRHEAGLELGYCGAAAQGALLRSLGDPHATVRRIATFALGETRTQDARAVQALVPMLKDADALVRSNAAFSLGSLARVQALDSHALDALLECLDPSAEPDNLDNAALSRSTVRECVAGALLLAAAGGQLSDAQRLRLAAQGLQDTDRYVRGLTVQALRLCVDATLPEWIRLLLAYLDERQFVPRPAGPALATTPNGLWNSRTAVDSRP